jgi:hypothetical protein
VENTGIVNIESFEVCFRIKNVDGRTLLHSDRGDQVEIGQMINMCTMTGSGEKIREIRVEEYNLNE